MLLFKIRKSSIASLNSFKTMQIPGGISVFLNTCTKLLSDDMTFDCVLYIKKGKLFDKQNCVVKHFKWIFFT